MFRDVLALEDSPISDMPGNAGLAIADDNFADAAPQAIRGYEGISRNDFTACQLYAHARGVLLERLDFAGGAQRDIGQGLAGFQEDLVKVGSINDAVGIPISGEGGFAQRHAHDLLAGAHVVHAQARGEEGYTIDRFGQAQVLEHLEDVGPELYPRSDLATRGGLLQPGPRTPVSREHEPRAQPADAAAGNDQL